MTDRRPQAPRGLDAAGRKLWADVVAEFELSAGELPVLEVACRNLDRMRAAEAVVAAEGLVVPGRWAPQPHPAVQISRDAASLLRAAVRQLKVELAEDLGPPRAGPKSGPARRRASVETARAKRAALRSAS